MSTRNDPNNWAIAVATLLLSLPLSLFGHAQSVDLQRISTPNLSIESTSLGNRFPATIAIARDTDHEEPALSALAAELRELDISSIEEREARDKLIKQIAAGLKQCPTCNQVGTGAIGVPQIGLRPRQSSLPSLTNCQRQVICPEETPLFDTRDETCKAAEDL